MDILHKVGIKSSAPDRVFAALTTTEGVSAWWAPTSGETSKVGGKVQFTFGSHVVEATVVALEPGKRVTWEITKGSAEWLGTKVAFDVKAKDGDTTLLFKHQDWREPSDFMHHCSTKWGTFLMSLKAYLENGHGKPFPNDVHIE